MLLIRQLFPYLFYQCCCQYHFINYPGANIERKNSQWSPFFIVADRGNLELYQYVSEKVNLINPAKVDGRTPLDFAAMNGNLSICRFIVANSAEKNPKDVDGITTLHLAARYGQLLVCRMLVRNVSDKNPQCNLGRTPFHAAAIGESFHFEFDGALSLNVATTLEIGDWRYRRLEICKLFIENISDKNPSDMHGYTVLHAATRSGHLEICRLVIQSVINKNPQSHFGDTPLHEAARGGHLEVCRLLMESVDDIDPVNGRGELPLHESVRSGNIQVYKLLWGNGFRNLIIKKELVKIAFQEGNLDMCKFLVDNEENCNMNIINRVLFMTLLMYLNSFFGTNFRRIWPKHYFAAVCLNLMIPFTLQILYMKTFETFVSNVFVNNLLESGHSLHFLLFSILCIVFYSTFIVPYSRLARWHFYTSFLPRFNNAAYTLMLSLVSVLTSLLFWNPLSCLFYLCIFTALRFCIKRMKGF